MSEFLLPSQAQPREEELFRSAQQQESPSQSSSSFATTKEFPLASPKPTLQDRSPSDPKLSHRLQSCDDSKTRLSGYVSDKARPSASSAANPSPQKGKLHPQVLSGTNDNGQTWADLEFHGQPDRSSNNSIFRALEDYISDCFTGCATLNSSFLTAWPQPTHSHSERAASEGQFVRPRLDRANVSFAENETALSELDAKTLLLGDFAENGSWWAGGRVDQNQSIHDRHQEALSETWKEVVSLKTPHIAWADLAEWYHLVTHVGENWKVKWNGIRPHESDHESNMQAARWEAVSSNNIEREMAEARIHTQRALLKATENLLKRPRRPLKRAEDCRFLLILLANPLLHTADMADKTVVATQQKNGTTNTSPQSNEHTTLSPNQRHNSPKRAGGPGHHSGIVKRILGLISNLPNETHQFLVSWLSRYSDTHFQRLVDLVCSFVTYRLSRPHSQKRIDSVNLTTGLIPSFSSEAGAHHPSQVHAALDSGSSQSKTGNGKPNLMSYGEDWQLRAAARVMALFFSANAGHPSRKHESAPSFDQRMQSAGLSARYNAHSHGQLIPISSFYNTLLDYADLVADFDAWESNRGKFSFCQYPFFLSIWAKIHILEHDARRQMEVKAREAFFDSILSHRAVSQYLVLKVRRDCLVEDSLRRVSEVVGSGQEEIKKGLKIDFAGEEGVDAGGLRKEWFLLLVREIFDPHYGLFVYDDDSGLCYFNPFCFESSEQFFLVGVLLGLAIYNSTILDVAFPPFAFKKLLASAPAINSPTTTALRMVNTYTLEDLGEYRPVLARGLRQLLEFKGDVQETFCRDFVADVDRYGEIVQIPLCPGGEKKAVTNANRREFVELYVHYLLDVVVARQFEPFKRGFFTVCGGNALSLFRPEEIELLIRGSDEPLDIASLRAVAIYEGWPDGNKHPELQPQVVWFWDFFERASPADQRKILSFITGSDRIPAMGATNLVIRVLLLGPATTGKAADSERFPSARTCFNMLGLYAYETMEKLERKLWMAVCNSEGFGLK